jgi:hypothetical protein
MLQQGRNVTQRTHNSQFIDGDFSPLVRYL